MYSTASFTVAIFSASSSGISIPNASSKAITSSTVSSESAPRSSTNEALGVTSPSSTPSCSTIICFTRSSTLAILIVPPISRSGTLGCTQESCAPLFDLPILCGANRPVNLSNSKLQQHFEHSARVHAAVHTENLSGDVTGLVARQKHD